MPSRLMDKTPHRKPDESIMIRFRLLFSLNGTTKPMHRGRPTFNLRLRKEDPALIAHDFSIATSARHHLI
jgi:hypothetical protein